MRHGLCIREGVVGSSNDPAGWEHPRLVLHTLGGFDMKWTKPEAEIVAVTMEVTAYVATL
jgi:coenzyme PQQ precursor peptide PqqA